MMNDELIKRLKDYYSTARKGEIAELMEEAADAIEELQAAVSGYEATTDVEFVNEDGHERIRFVPKWIPVTERLPEKTGNYLTAMGNGRIIENVFMMDDSDAWQNWHPHGKWYYNEAVWAGITHWMPLPTPPKEET